MRLKNLKLHVFKILNSEISSESECKAAVADLGLAWGQTWNSSIDFPACYHAEDGQNLVYFNESPNPGRTNLYSKYAAICTGK